MEEEKAVKENKKHKCVCQRDRACRVAREMEEGSGGVREVEFCGEESREKGEEGEEGGQSGSESPVIALTLS